MATKKNRGSFDDIAGETRTTLWWNIFSYIILKSGPLPTNDWSTLQKAYLEYWHSGVV